MTIKIRQLEHWSLNAHGIGCFQVLHLWKRFCFVLCFFGLLSCCCCCVKRTSWGHYPSSSFKRLVHCQFSQNRLFFSRKALCFSVCFSDLMGRMAVIKQQFRLHLILHAFRLSYLVKQTAFAHTLFSSAVTVISMGFPSFYGNRCRCVSVHTQLL